MFGEPVSVKEKDSVNLLTGLTEIQANDVLDWRFGAGQDLIARVNKAAGMNSIYNEVLDGKFKDRLHLDDKTGSLTIMNVRSTDSGDYEVSTSITGFKKTFTVGECLIHLVHLKPNTFTRLLSALLVTVFVFHY